MADAADLKSDVERRVGSNPTGGTNYIFNHRKEIIMSVVEWLMSKRYVKVKFEKDVDMDGDYCSCEDMLTITMNVGTYKKLTESDVYLKYEVSKTVYGEVTDEEVVDILNSMYDESWRNEHEVH